MTTPPRVYTDFNALEYSDESKLQGEIPLTGYGTLASLARQRLQLSNGMKFVAYEDGGPECEAIARFEPIRTDPAGRKGEWVAAVNLKNIRKSSKENNELDYHPCSNCNRDLSQSSTYRRSFVEVCDFCGTSIMTPLAPPKEYES